MTNWRRDDIHVDTLHREDGNILVLEIDGQRHFLSEQKADALVGELSISGARNPNRGSRYRLSERSGNVDSEAGE